MLTILAAFLAMTNPTAQTCITLDNRANNARFAIAGMQPFAATYTDYGDNLGYSRPIPRKAWKTTQQAEAAMRAGKASWKIVTVCS